MMYCLVQALGRSLRERSDSLLLRSFGDGVAERMLQCVRQSTPGSARMPVTAKSSKLFCDRLGGEVANKLVEWFNVVDEDYRGQLRALNELNFARFDAKVEQRMAELRADLNTKIDRVHTELSAKIDGIAPQLTATLERRLGDQTRWLFVAWASLLIPVIGLWARR
jgi:hypothetical protein